MDNAQKAIMIGVGLFITIIIISAVLLIVNLGTGLVDDATAELGSISTTLQNQILQNYDGKIVSGTQVRAAINTYFSDPDISVAVYSRGDSPAPVVQVGARVMTLAATNITDAITQNTVTITDANGLTEFATSTDEEGAVTRTQRGSITNTTDPAFINTAINFRSAVVRNAANDTIVGIVFQPIAR